MFKPNKPTPEQAYEKIKHYCGYQERCHKEVKDKLYGYGLYKKEVDQLLSRLIEEEYLNEERFAKLFAGGHFRTKQWGRKKIEFALKEKQISVYCIKKGLAEIDDVDYEKTLLSLATKKWNSLKGEQYIKRQAKTRDYLLQKGYEAALVMRAVQHIFNPET